MDNDCSYPEIVIACDRHGRVRSVLRDEVGLSANLEPGQAFASLVDEDSLARAFDFLTAIRTRSSAAGWELNVPVGGRPTLMHFAGGLAGESLPIAGARSLLKADLICDDLVELEDGRTFRLRDLLRGTDTGDREQAHRDLHLMEELAHLNNDLVNLQRELAKKNAQLEKLDEAKNRFLGMAAHDLRSPLAVIILYSKFLTEKSPGELTEEQQRFIAIIRKRSEFMLRLIDELLDLTNIEAGRLRLELDPLNLSSLVRRKVAVNAPLAAEKTVNLAFILDAELPEIAVDRTRIEQVLDNLLSNALMFSPPGSTVEVRVGQREGSVLISVKDQGPGIAASELGRLFQPFERTSARSPHGEKGTGLDLAIASKIMAAHGGAIWVESEEGRGSTFYVTLPIAPLGASASSPESP